MVNAMQSRGSIIAIANTGDLTRFNATGNKGQLNRQAIVLWTVFVFNYRSG